MYIYTYKYMYIYIYIFVCIYKYVCIYNYIFTYIQLYTYLNVDVNSHKAKRLTYLWSFPAINCAMSFSRRANLSAAM